MGKNLNHKVSYDISLLTNDDIHFFNEGSHFNLYNKLGSHPVKNGKQKGYYFAVWAPNANKVSVCGDFNEWNKSSHQLKPKGSSGIWEGFIEGLEEGSFYKYHIISDYNNYTVDKPDPYGFYFEKPPNTASVTYSSKYKWHDKHWMESRAEANKLNSPISIYEIHLGSWKRKMEEENRWLNYREIAPLLTDYLKDTGFTHVELMPIMEHPFYGSWGYQITGYFAPSARYGNPDDFKYFVDYLHNNGIGVILDWVPSHYPKDEHGLGFFDGTHLYEHSDPRKGIHPDWDSLIFNYGRKEVQSFLVSNAMFWLDEYHIDGLRLDAVASMLYLDYSREEGQWIPNKYGGNENIEAIEFLKKLNRQIYARYPDVQTFAEESTSWPMVSRPTYVGGLGFGMKWDMGWMHDTLSFFSMDPVYRKYHHGTLTFRMIYAFNENFVLPLSHDEVVHGKGSLISRMPGNDWQKFANLRLLFCYMFTQPGKKILFMGGEFGQWSEWYHEKSLDWHLLDYSPHQGIKALISDLNSIYKKEEALHQSDFSDQGFEWIDCSDYKSSIISFLRKDADNNYIVVILNFTPAVRENYRVGVPAGGMWKEIINTNSTHYGGSGVGNFGEVEAYQIPYHGKKFSLNLTIPPLAGLAFKLE